MRVCAVQPDLARRAPGERAPLGSRPQCGGLLTLPPHRGSEREGWHSGTADSLWRNAGLVRERAPDALVVLSADAVYTLDYREVVEEHLESGAEATMVTTDVEPAEAGRYGVVRVGPGGRVEDYAYKPDEPSTSTASNEVFVFSPGPVLDRLDALADQAGEEGLEDLGTALLPALARDGAARAHRFDGYWRDVGTLEAYWQAHRDFLGPHPPIDLDDPAWPVLTRAGRRSAARVLPGAAVEDSLGSAGACDARVGGDGELTVVGREAVVEAGAELPAGTRYPEPEQGR